VAVDKPKDIYIYIDELQVMAETPCLIHLSFTGLLDLYNDERQIEGLSASERCTVITLHEDRYVDGPWSWTA
jgi:hypothetical protein